MHSIRIDYNTSWNNLPWMKIDEKIYIIQKKIYQYSLDCNKKKLYRLQNYILNSNDVKIFAIRKVLYSIEQYYINNNKEKYFLNDIDKLLIYEILLSKILHNNKYEIFINKIKQYIIYLCISPEWKARLEPLHGYNSSNNEYNFIERITKFLLCQSNKKLISNYTYYLNNQIIYKFININHILNRLNSLQNIKLYMISWLKNQNIAEPLYYIIHINNINICMLLYHLIYKIIYNGIYWYNIINLQNYIKNCNFFKKNFVFFDKKYYYSIFTHSKVFHNIVIDNIFILSKYISWHYLHSIIIAKNNKSHHIINDYIIEKKRHNNYELSIELKIEQYKYFLKRIKNILYHKDTLNRWRINNKKNLVKYLNQINVHIIIFYTFYNPIVNDQNIETLFKIIDKFIIYWIKKQNYKLSSYYDNKKYLINYLILKYR